nr:extensin-like [Camelus dromedarius]
MQEGEKTPTTLPPRPRPFPKSFLLSLPLAFAGDEMPSFITAPARKSSGSRAYLPSRCTEGLSFLSTLKKKKKPKSSSHIPFTTTPFFSEDPGCAPRSRRPGPGLDTSSQSSPPASLPDPPPRRPGSPYGPELAEEDGRTERRPALTGSRRPASPARKSAPSHTTRVESTQSSAPPQRPRAGGGTEGRTTFDPRASLTPPEAAPRPSPGLPRLP